MADVEQTNQRREASSAAGLPAKEGPPRGSGGFAGGVFALGGGAAAAHLLALVAFPIVSRLFAPEAFGQAAMFMAIVSVIGTIAPLRYETALMLPESDAKAANLFVVACLFVVGVAAAACLAVALVGDGPGIWLKSDALRHHKWLLPVGIFVWGIDLCLRSWSARFKHFKRLGVLTAAEALASGTLKVCAGAAGLTSGGALVVVNLLARSVPSLGMLGRLIPRGVAFIVSHCNLRTMRQMARRYVRFPLLETWSGLMAMISFHLPFVLLGAAFDTAVVGLYSRAILLVRLPHLVIGHSVARVFFQRAAAKQAAGEQLTELVDAVLQRLIWIAVLPMAVVALIGPELLEVVAGRRWHQAGVYAQLLTPWLLMVSITVPLVDLIRVLDRLGFGLGFRFFRLAGQIVALLIGGWLLREPKGALLLLGLVGAAAHAVLGWYLLRAAGVRMARAGGCALRYLLYAMPTLAAGAIAKWWLGLLPWQVVIVVVAASLSYFALVIHHDRWARSLASDLLERIGCYRKPGRD